VPELRHLRYFVAVAEELNFSRAARRLRMAQPPLSVAISQLEQEIGTSLFHRRSREVKLTERRDVRRPDQRRFDEPRPLDGPAIVSGDRTRSGSTSSRRSSVRRSPP